MIYHYFICVLMPAQAHCFYYKEAREPTDDLIETESCYICVTQQKHVHKSVHLKKNLLEQDPNQRKDNPMGVGQSATSPV